MNPLIRYLINEGYIVTPEIQRAFSAIDRAKFTGGRFSEGEIYQDVALTLESGEMMFHPSTTAQMVELLAPKPDEKVLEVGTGSGWQTAVIACLVSNFANMANADNKDSIVPNAEHESPNDGDVFISSAIVPRGRVISIERNKLICEQAVKNIEQYGFMRGGVVAVIRRDGVFGYNKEAPYDKIISTICPNVIPPKWKDNLKVGGRLVTPFGQSILVLDKTGKNSFKKSSYFGFTFSKTVFA
ncbi:MAG: hypothetical protein Q7R98_00215 [Candidatus Jorgensenbacteria bacterium]|nr:hypothetical protein [Candidatus Jorgensenbacteria bacterium]